MMRSLCLLSKMVINAYVPFIVDRARPLKIVVKRRHRVICLHYSSKTCIVASFITSHSRPNLRKETKFFRAFLVNWRKRATFPVSYKPGILVRRTLQAGLTKRQEGRKETLGTRVTTFHVRVCVIHLSQFSLLTSPPFQGHHLWRGKRVERRGTRVSFHVLLLRDFS